MFNIGCKSYIKLIFLAMKTFSMNTLSGGFDTQAPNRELIEKYRIKDLALKLGINPKILENEDALYTIFQLIGDLIGPECRYFTKGETFPDNSYKTRDITQEEFSEAYKKLEPALRSAVDENGNLNIVDTFRHVLTKIYLDDKNLIHIDEDMNENEEMSRFKVYRSYHESGVQMSYRYGDNLFERNPDFVTAQYSKLDEVDDEPYTTMPFFTSKLSFDNKLSFDSGGLVTSFSSIENDRIIIPSYLRSDEGKSKCLFILKRIKDSIKELLEYGIVDGFTPEDFQNADSEENWKTREAKKAYKQFIEYGLKTGILIKDGEKIIPDNKRIFSLFSIKDDGANIDIYDVSVCIGSNLVNNLSEDTKNEHKL